VVLLLSVVFGVILPRRRRRAALRGPIAVVGFAREQRTALPPRPSRRSPVEVVPINADAAAPVEAGPPPGPNAPAVPVEMRAMELETAANEDRVRVFRVASSAGERRDAGRDERTVPTLRLERPYDGTLPFLPGRLEVVEGRDVGQEIKFVRTPGPDGTTVTFGRSEGAHYRHVQLHEATVSRMHGKMVLDGKSWSLVNLSATNPVVVNGLPLAGEGSSVVLRDGDRIEMGEVVFRFRAK
jgi:Inner membrane component of T3SS, cytoplasmic domain